MPEIKKSFSLYKPTTATPFHIDFDWWQKNDSNWRIFLKGFLCDKHQAYFADKEDDLKIDAVDPETAEVKKGDGLLYVLMNHCTKQENFISENLPLIAKIFRIFLANGNQPLTPEDLEVLTNRPSRTILVTLTGLKVYRGIRQVR